MRLIWRFVFFLAALTACGQPTLPLTLNATTSGFVGSPSKANKPNLIVFVHGIFGDAQGTWQRAGARPLYDVAISEGGLSDSADVYVFGYPSTKLGRDAEASFTIREAGRALEAELKRHRVAETYARIVFVGHSMGGLVTLQALLNDPALRSKVPLVVSYGTPYQGAQIAAIGRLVFPNPGLDVLRTIEKNGNEYLAALNDQWRRLKESPGAPKVRCAYEKKTIAPLDQLIVPEASGTALCDGAASAIEEDHLDMVKPTSAQHRSVTVFVNAYREDAMNFVAGAVPVAKTPSQPDSPSPCVAGAAGAGSAGSAKAGAGGVAIVASGCAQVNFK